MDKIFLSIIIPYYNTEFMLFKKCIDSIRTIKIPMEIIVVDDGSNSECKNQCTDYIKSEARVRWIEKENGGVSSARNRGILEARGQYLWFMDADDEAKEEFVYFINERYQEIEADWLLFDIEVYDVKHKRVYNRRFFPKYAVENKKEIYDLDYLEVLELRVGSKELSECWAKLIRREILVSNQIEFPVGVLTGEDRIFNTRLLKVLQKIQYVSILAYRYNYMPRIAERILHDPYKRYEYVALEKVELEEIIEQKVAKCNKERYQKKQKAILIDGIVKDCLVYERENRLDKNLKEYLQKWIQDNRIFQNVGAEDCRGCKGKLYYFILKYRIWIAVKVISYLKKGK